MHYRLKGNNYRQAQGLRKGDEHPIYAPANGICNRHVYLIQQMRVS